MEVGIIEREEWRSVEISSGGESVMMNGMKMMLLLCADNWNCQKVHSQLAYDLLFLMHVP